MRQIVLSRQHLTFNRYNLALGIQFDQTLFDIWQEPKLNQLNSTYNNQIKLMIFGPNQHDSTFDISQHDLIFAKSNQLDIKHGLAQLKR